MVDMSLLTGQVMQLLGREQTGRAVLAQPCQLFSKTYHTAFVGGAIVQYIVRQYYSTIHSTIHSTIVLEYHSAIVPWYYSTMVLWYHGTILPCIVI